MTTDSQTDLSKPPVLRFPLVYLFYAITVLAAALATFGVAGIIPAAVILLAWVIIFSSQSRPKTLALVMLLAGLFGLVTCCLLPAVQNSREASRRGTCQNNLRQLAIALHEYYDDYGSFPPANVADSSDKPRHSWRVLILPYLEEEKLYKAYNFNEPWNGPNNSKLATPVPQPFRCPTFTPAPGQPPVVPNYFAVVGPGTAWPGSTSLRFADVKDDPATTLLLVESHDARVNWLDPRDLSAEEVVSLLSDDSSGHGTHHAANNFFYDNGDNGRMVAFVNQDTKYVGGLSEGTARALVGRADGRKLSPEDLYGEIILTQSRPKYDNWFRLALFTLVVLFPLPWVWISPAGRLRTR